MTTPQHRTPPAPQDNSPLADMAGIQHKAPGHTPTPWSIVQCENTRRADQEIPIEAADQSRAIAWVKAPIGDTEGEANARLFLAAPDLLAAAQKLMDWFDSVGGNSELLDAAIDAARDALKKARGE